MLLDERKKKKKKSPQPFKVFKDPLLPPIKQSNLDIGDQSHANYCYTFDNDSSIIIIYMFK